MADRIGLRSMIAYAVDRSHKHVLYVLETWRQGVKVCHRQGKRKLRNRLPWDTT